jgi:hypothetical protein
VTTWICGVLAVLAGIALFGRELIRWELPILDLLQFGLSVVALIWIPRFLASRDRRDAFKGGAVGRYLEPAIDRLFTITDCVARIQSGPMDPADLRMLSDHFRELRTSIDRARRVAKALGWDADMLGKLDTIFDMARNLYRLSTDKPAQRAADIRDISAALTNELLVALRSLVV